MQIFTNLTKSEDTLVSDNELLQFAERVVNRFIANKHIPKREKEDVQMAIVEKFLIRRKRIFDSFQGKSKVSTYCIAVLNRMCLEIIRKEIKHWNLSEDKHKEIREDKGLDSVDNLIIIDEIRFLRNIISLFYDEKAKIVLFLAYYYQLNINKMVISEYDSNYINHNLLELFEYPKNITKGMIFENLTKAANIVENRNNKNDATRIWLNKIVNSIIIKLNSPFQRANYNKESLEVLFEYYYNDIIYYNKS